MQNVNMETLNMENSAIISQPLDFAKKNLEDLYTKYADDPYVFSKMHNYVCWKLPAVIEDMKRTNDERRARNDILSTEQDAFINAFLNTNQYFYCSLTERYFLYDGVHYQLRREDDVLHHILTTITKEHNTLIPRKPQTKVYVMKRVKESNPLKSTPESATIQVVLDALCPTFFTTKPAAKYFLSIVGDHLLKRTDETTHAYFASPKAKDFLRELGAISQSMFGINATALFKHKYHYHAYKTIRLVKFSDTVGVDAVWRAILNEIAIDLCCVAAHYSGRYESADQYLEQYADEPELARYALYFRGKLPKDVVEEFIAEYLELTRRPNTQYGVRGEPTILRHHPERITEIHGASSEVNPQILRCLQRNITEIHGASSEVNPQILRCLQRNIAGHGRGGDLVSGIHASDVMDSSVDLGMEIPAISLYTMDYLWKKYLRERQFPAVLGPPALTNMIIELLPAAKYDPEIKQFIGVSSPHLQIIERFHRFWEECIVDDAKCDSLDEYEIDEMTAMYREWSSGAFRMTDSQMLDLIRFYKQVDIMDSKYVQGLRCTLWDKRRELEMFFENLRKNREDKNGPNTISFYDAYNAYKSRCAKRIVSKLYFEKYIFNVLPDFVLEGKILAIE